MIATLTDFVDGSGTTEPLRFTAALSDGRNLYAFRYSDKTNSANTLYYRESGDNVVVASEPLDKQQDVWKIVPPSHALIACSGERVVLHPFPDAKRIAAE
jgi:glutamine amidotransferase